jgi:hypothetical protein
LNYHTVWMADLGAKRAVRCPIKAMSAYRNSVLNSGQSQVSNLADVVLVRINQWEDGWRAYRWFGKARTNRHVVE